MISAMPAVALRRERRKGRAIRGLGSSSQPGSLVSLSKNKAQHNNSSGKSNSEPNSARVHLEKKSLEAVDENYSHRQRLNYFVYAGTFCLITGIIILFIGVSIDKTTTQAVGFVFTVVGSVLCISRVVISEKYVKSDKKPTCKVAEVPLGRKESQNLSGVANDTKDVEVGFITELNKNP